MQATITKQDTLWLKAAIRECITYGEHGIMIELDNHGHRTCFNCGGVV